MAFGRIYKITNTINGKAYIGQTTRTIHYRFDHHKRAKNGCRKLIFAFNKYGRDNFYIEEIATANSQDELDALEVYFIASLKSIENGYNLESGGKSGRKKTKEQKQLLSLKMSAFGNPFYGKKHSDFSKNAMSISKTGIKRPNYKRTIESRIRSKPIIGINVENGEKFTLPSIASGEAFGFTPCRIRDCCKGRRKTHHGFSWQYINISNSLFKNLNCL